MARLTRVSPKDVDTPARSTAYGFVASGNLDTITDAKNRIEKEDQDSLNRTTSILDTAQQLTQLVYDNRDNLSQVTNARNIILRQYQYDKNNRLLKELLPDDSTLQQHRGANKHGHTTP